MMTEDRTMAKKPCACAYVLMAIATFIIGGLLIYYFGDEIAPLQFGALVAITAISSGALYCFCTSKLKGFGPYNTSTLIIVLVVAMAAILAVVGLFDRQAITSVFLAIVGFAAGIFTSEQSKN